MAQISYQLIRSSRRTIAIQIKPDGEVVVRAPNRMSRADIDRFVAQKRGWIEAHLPVQPVEKLSEAGLRELAEKAKQVIPERVKHFAPLVGVNYGRITIRSQHTRWGSCSAKGNLNFNCLLMLMPEEIIDYVVVHELCHRKEMNHSAAFWAEVERILPDWQERRRWLKDHGKLLIAKI